MTATLPDLDLLQSFVAVVDEGSFSRAAIRVARSQAAVSMQIQRLERQAGRTLLTRGPGAVRPNAAGEALLGDARRILSLARTSWARITEPSEAGLVRLGIPDDYAAALLPPVLTRFALAHPLMTLELVCEPSSLLVPAIEAGRVDLALVTRQPEQALEVLRRESLVWVAAPHHAPWLLDPLPIALYEPGCSARAHVLSALGEAGRACRATYSSPSLMGLIAVVQSGLAVAALARCSVPSRFRIIGSAEGLPPLRDLEVALMRRSQATSPAVDRLAEFLRTEISRSG